MLVLLLRPWDPPTVACPGTGLTRAACDLRDGGTTALAAGAVLLFVAAAGASLVVSALAFPLVRLLSGTLVPLGPPGALLLALRRRRKSRLLSRSGQRGDTVTPSPAVARSLGALRRLPVRDEALVPTRIGNSFAAMSERVWARHRIDANLCWPVLQQLFDEPARREVDQASEQVLGRARNLLWSLATVVAALACGPLERVDARPVAVAAVAAGVVAALLLAGLGNSVDEYADRVEAAVLRHRDALYRSAGWPLPVDTEAERAGGETFTAYLTRKDLDPFTVVFERPEPPREEPPT
ncbi:hypothetical protein [Streptomyces sp. NPDC048606]|uniref:hypothetical protein n=1 Tax=Streptomyces sp. NPDC048606 TaxID=3154726 RepID=UPI0034145EA3